MRALAFALTGLSGCVTDANGESCSAFDALHSGEDTYCPDPEAPLDCQLVVDYLVDAFEVCMGRRFDEESARAAAEDAIDCTQAVATTSDFDACLAALEDPECGSDRLPVMPESCQGAVLLHEE